MEAKDTVMKPNNVQIMPYLKDFVTTVTANDKEAAEIVIGRMVLEIAQRQAEISFKAGREEEAKGGHNSISYLEGYQEGKKVEGIKKVIEAVKPLLEEIDGLVSDIEGDWTDPRYECSKISKLIGEWFRVRGIK